MSINLEDLKDVETKSLASNEVERLALPVHVYRNLIRRKANLMLYLYSVLFLTLIMVVVI